MDKELEELKHFTEKYDIITFDVFDTLIIRDIPKPVDLFTLLHGRWFKLCRLAAERIARIMSSGEDVTLDEIYKLLPFYNSQDEIECEKKICRVNKTIYDLYSHVKRQGKKVYAISDMYLPKAAIEAILNANGIEADGVYVSSEYKLCKATGNLFRKFCEKEGILPSAVLHMGDNYAADVEGAEKAGISACHIQRKRGKLLYSKAKGKELVLRSFIQNNLAEMDDRCERIGYEVMGPILVSFCQWIHRQKEKYGFDRLYYMSRDMHMPFKIYNLLYDNDYSNYFIVSRKALNSALQSRENFCKYIKKMGCHGNVAVIDTGWRCLAQPIIEQYALEVDKDTEIGGLYLGIKWGYYYIKRSKKSACCFCPTKFSTIHSQTYSSLIEEMIGVNEPKVSCYDLEGNPVYGNETRNIGNMKSVQSGIMRFANDWKEHGNIDIDEKAVFKAYYSLCDRPHGEDIELLGEAEYDDVTTSKIVTFKPLGHYIRHMGSFF